MIFQDLKQVDDDLSIVAGDFGVIASDKQHQKDIINSQPGWWKNAPWIGVGIINFVNSSGQLGLLNSTMKQMLEADGYTVNNPTSTINAAGTLIARPDAVRT